jgi:hypothetical protein
VGFVDVKSYEGRSCFLFLLMISPNMPRFLLCLTKGRLLIALLNMTLPFKPNSEPKFLHCVLMMEENTKEKNSSISVKP